jgi:hypothetical protein
LVSSETITPEWGYGALIAGIEQVSERLAHLGFAVLLEPPAAFLLVPDRAADGLDPVLVGFRITAHDDLAAVQWLDAQRGLALFRVGSGGLVHGHCFVLRSQWLGSGRNWTRIAGVVHLACGSSAEQILLAAGHSDIGGAVGAGEGEVVAFPVGLRLVGSPAVFVAACRFGRGLLLGAGG